MSVLSPSRDRQECLSCVTPATCKGTAKAKIVPMQLQNADVKLFEKAAKATKQSLSEWMRLALREAATK